MSNHESYLMNFGDKRICRHPCFNNYDFHSAILHLPIAKVENVYRKNHETDTFMHASHMQEESQNALSLQEALTAIKDVRKSLPTLSVVAVSGPKEPLADFESIKNAFLYVRSVHPEMILCLSTNGLMLPVYAKHLISLGLNCISITMHTLNPQTGAKIYEKIVYMGQTYDGVEGANILIQNQMEGIHTLVTHQIAVRLTIPVIKGMNEEEVEQIVRFAKESGCKFTNVIKEGGAEKESGLEAYDSDGYGDKRKQLEQILPQSYFCKSCRSGTVETLNTVLVDQIAKADEVKKQKQEKQKISIRFAVCSQNGILTDQHFGESSKLYIYEYLDDVVTFLEIRVMQDQKEAMENGKKKSRMYHLIRSIEDCNCVICMRIGSCPLKELKEKSIDTYMTYNLIEDGIKEAVDHLYQGRRIR